MKLLPMFSFFMMVCGRPIHVNEPEGFAEEWPLISFDVLPPGPATSATFPNVVWLALGGVGCVLVGVGLAFLGVWVAKMVKEKKKPNGAGRPNVSRPHEGRMRKFTMKLRRKKKNVPVESNEPSESLLVDHLSDSSIQAILDRPSESLRTAVGSSSASTAIEEKGEEVQGGGLIPEISNYAAIM